jgi:hypothetical protein
MCDKPNLYPPPKTAEQLRILKEQIESDKQSESERLKRATGRLGTYLLFQEDYMR